MSIETVLQTINTNEVNNNSFEYFIKENKICAIDSSLTFGLSIEQLNTKVIPIIKILESYSSIETLIKFELFDSGIIKFSALNGKVFSDILLKSKHSFVFNTGDYFSFVVSSDKFLKFISLLTSGNLKFILDLKIHTLTLQYNTLEINLELKQIDSFLNYEKTLTSKELISNKFDTLKIKQGLDFSNMIFSKHDEINKSKEININNNLIFSQNPYIGCSASKFDSFGNIDSIINNDNIKFLSTTLSILNPDITFLYKTDRSILIKDNDVLIGIPLPKMSIIELKNKVNDILFERQSKCRVQINRKNLIQSLTALSIFLKDLHEDLVSFVFVNNELKIMVKDLVTNRESFDTFPILYSGDLITIKLKFDSILKNLKYFNNRELVDIEVLILNENVQTIRISETHLGCTFTSCFLDNSNY